MKSVTLYRVVAPIWLTEATIQPNGDLTIISGDLSNTWVLTVLAESKPTVLQALQCDNFSRMPENGDTDDCILALLGDRFIGDSNPYEAIDEFFCEINCPPHSSVWISA